MTRKFFSPDGDGDQPAAIEIPDRLGSALASALTEFSEADSELREIVCAFVDHAKLRRYAAREISAALLEVIRSAATPGLVGAAREQRLRALSEKTVQWCLERHPAVP